MKKLVTNQSELFMNNLVKSKHECKRIELSCSLVANDESEKFFLFGSEIEETTFFIAITSQSRFWDTFRRCEAPLISWPGRDWPFWTENDEKEEVLPYGRHYLAWSSLSPLLVRCVLACPIRPTRDIGLRARYDRSTRPLHVVAANEWRIGWLFAAGYSPPASGRKMVEPQKRKTKEDEKMHRQSWAETKAAGKARCKVIWDDDVTHDESIDVQSCRNSVSRPKMEDEKLEDKRMRDEERRWWWWWLQLKVKHVRKTDQPTKAILSNFAFFIWTTKPTEGAINCSELVDKRLWWCCC